MTNIEGHATPYSAQATYMEGEITLISYRFINK